MKLRVFASIGYLLHKINKEKEKESDSSTDEKAEITKAVMRYEYAIAILLMLIDKDDEFISDSFMDTLELFQIKQKG
jgi:hypothetical protein